MKAVIGLGNPGPKYQETRHNAGFWVVDEIARHLGVAVDHPKAKSMIVEARWEGEELLLAKPVTYMNQSGEAVRGSPGSTGSRPMSSSSSTMISTSRRE